MGDPFVVQRFIKWPKETKKKKKNKSERGDKMKEIITNSRRGHNERRI